MAWIWIRVMIGKINLDVVGCAWLNGVTRKAKIELVHGLAPLSDLTNADILCIEAGGLGRTRESNFSCHKTGTYKYSATLQAYRLISQKCDLFHGEEIATEEDHVSLDRLAWYINTMETIGAKGLRSYGRVEFPCLSDIFAGIILVERDPVEQLHKGTELLDSVFCSRRDPMRAIPGFAVYAEAKAKDNRRHPRKCIAFGADA